MKEKVHAMRSCHQVSKETFFMESLIFSRNIRRPVQWCMRKANEMRSAIQWLSVHRGQKMLISSQPFQHTAFSLRLKYSLRKDVLCTSAQKSTHILSQLHHTVSIFNSGPFLSYLWHQRFCSISWISNLWIKLGSSKPLSNITNRYETASDA